jgi:hypothetical protein
MMSPFAWISPCSCSPAVLITRSMQDFFARTIHPDTAFKRTHVATPPVKLPDRHTEYEVDKIVRYRLRRGRPLYSVHWKGYGDHENSWVPAVDLRCPDLFADFHRTVDSSFIREDVDRFHPSIAMYRQAMYRYATFSFHLSFPHFGTPHVPLPCHPHHNT